jgi:dynein intermediate chain 2, axonemal
MGKPCNFTDTEGVVLHEMKSDPSVKGEYMYSVPASLVVDNIRTFSAHTVNTERILIESRGQSHCEGGWPKDIDPNEPQDTTKFRKRLDKDPVFTGVVSTLCRDMQSLIDQNNSIDMYEEFYEGELVELEMQSFDCKTLSVCKSPLSSAVNQINWHPDGATRFLACCTDLKSQSWDKSISPPSSFIWESENSNTPLYELFPTSPLVTGQFYTRNGDLVAGGGFNGQVDFFDLRAGLEPVSVSSFEYSHSAPIFDLCWLQSKTHQEIVTTSPDGRCLWWDIRNMAKPLEECDLDGRGGTCIEWAQEAGPTKFLVGTQEGVPVSLNRKPKKSVEIGTVFSPNDPSWSPVYAIKRNRYHPKYFSTVSGDGCVRLWLEDIKVPLVEFASSGCPLTSGGWSRTRPGVFFAGKFDGSIDFYDMIYEMNQVSYSHRISDCPVTAVSLEGTNVMAVGDAAGCITLVRLCDELCVPVPNEKGIMGNILEREQRRERNLDTIKKQKQAKQITTADKENAKYIDQEQYGYSSACFPCPSCLGTQSEKQSGWPRWSNRREFENMFLGREMRLFFAFSCMHFNSRTTTYMLDIRGIGYGMSLRSSVLSLIAGMSIFTGLIIIGSFLLYNINNKPVFDLTVMMVFLDYHAVIAWTTWLICMTWGWVAISIPARPREAKKAALTFLAFLLFLHAVAHALWIIVLCRRCYVFFLNLLAGNFIRDGVEIAFGKISTSEFVNSLANAATEITNALSIPLIYKALQSVPPLDIIYMFGLNWVFLAFLLGVIPILMILTAIPVVATYRRAIVMGGNGTENCAPSQIELFYSLHHEDRKDIREGTKNIADFEYFEESEGEKNRHHESSHESSFERSDDPGGYDSKTEESEIGRVSTRRQKASMV